MSNKFDLDQYYLESDDDEPVKNFAPIKRKKRQEKVKRQPWRNNTNKRKEFEKDEQERENHYIKQEE